MPDFIKNTENPTPVTLANWVPKKSAEDDIRLRLDFELPLGDDLIDRLPKQIKSIANFVAKTDHGVPSMSVPEAAYDQSIELYLEPDHNKPQQSFTPVQIRGMKVWRPSVTEGDTKELYLDFHVTVKANGLEGEALAGWMLRYMRSTLYMRTHEVQGTFPGMEADAKPNKPARVRGGKDAASGEPIQ